MEGTSNTGIYAGNTNAAGTGPLNVTSEAVTGGQFGILARNYGAGALTIEANGDVAGTGALGTGIFARNYNANSTDLGVTTEGVTGGNRGINAVNFGAGALTVAANGDVEGTSDFGIFAQNNNANSTTLSVTSEGVTGGGNGIYARNEGTGALTIVANGDVEGTTDTGIYARNANAAGPLSVTSEGVTGGQRGIDAVNLGTGALTIAANGDVVGINNYGIRALNLGSSLSITSAGVTGGSGGINAANFGVGPLTIVTNGDVEGASATGIYASNTGTDLSVTSQDVAGGTNGIVAQNQGIGALTIIANGDVVGSTGAGIYTNVVGTGPATVTVSSGATVAGGSAGVQFGDSTITSNALNNFGNVSNPAGLAGTAIFGGASNETVNNFGVVTGNVLLGGGTNAFHNMDGGLFNSGTTVNLGAGNLLTNDGTLSPGGAFSPAGFVTTLTGDFVQPGSELDINLLGAAADRLDVTGDAELAGQVKPLFTLSGLGSATQWTVLTTESSPIQDNGIQAVDTHGCPDQVRA